MANHSNQWDLAKGWIGDCLEHHKSSCGMDLVSGSRPKRLIDVHRRELVVYPQTEAPYLALSYVWGNSISRQYTVGSILPDLPQTIEDALLVADLLGIRFLWVDQICIDQRDKQDQADEIWKMDSIYGGALATIVPLTAVDARSGISFLKYSRPTAQPFRSDGVVPENVCSSTEMNDLVTTSKWASRAWTFQEALLSPRCLLFTKTTIYFHCNVYSCYEKPDRTVNSQDSPLFQNPFRQLSPISGPDKEDSAYKIYEDIVRSYSTRQLSYDSDALNALAGISFRHQFLCYGAGTYCGLLHLQRFQISLGWEHHGAASRRSCFPSWSWAGWNGTVEKTMDYDVLTGDNCPPIRFRYHSVPGRRFGKASLQDKSAIDTFHLGPLACSVSASTLQECTFCVKGCCAQASKFSELDGTLPLDYTLLVEAIILHLPIRSPSGADLTLTTSLFGKKHKLHTRANKVWENGHRDFLWLYNTKVDSETRCRMVLLLLHYEDGIAYRMGIFSMDVDMDIMTKALKTKPRGLLLG